MRAARAGSKVDGRVTGELSARGAFVVRIADDGRGHTRRRATVGCTVGTVLAAVVGSGYCGVVHSPDQEAVR
jgi:hypothetical protein